MGYSPWGRKELDTTETTHTRTSAPVTRAGLPGLLTVCGQQVVRRFTSVFDRWLLTGWWSAGVRGSLGLASPIISGGSTSSQVVDKGKPDAHVLLKPLPASSLQLPATHWPTLIA